ncbi:hypothetical protein Tsubulata_045761 [Turnera subulata]|uniref:TF-B3 domain-containing protein n=1 Tax=Turnera subulata TaxID=218843 RepID=A0A9Q0FQJ7_9ROSI|nr:hypothetical protein Tsubulata_045761 [Turnera subulata]
MLVLENSLMKICWGRVMSYTLSLLITEHKEESHARFSKGKGKGTEGKAEEGKTATEGTAKDEDKTAKKNKNKEAKKPKKPKNKEATKAKNKKAKNSKNCRVRHHERTLIQGSHGRKWLLGITHKNGHYPAYFMNVGFGGFVDENMFGEGDVLQFELVDSKNPTLKVHIFHAQEFSGR